MGSLFFFAGGDTFYTLLSGDILPCILSCPAVPGRCSRYGCTVEPVEFGVCTGGTVKPGRVSLCMVSLSLSIYREKGTLAASQCC